MEAYRGNYGVHRIVRMIGALQLSPASEWNGLTELIKVTIEVSEFTSTETANLFEVLEYYRFLIII